MVVVGRARFIVRVGPFELGQLEFGQSACVRVGPVTPKAQNTRNSRQCRERARAASSRVHTRVISAAWREHDPSSTTPHGSCTLAETRLHGTSNVVFCAAQTQRARHVSQRRHRSPHTLFCGCLREIPCCHPSRNQRPCTTCLGAIHCVHLAVWTPLSCSTLTHSIKTLQYLPPLRPFSEKKTWEMLFVRGLLRRSSLSSHKLFKSHLQQSGQETRRFHLPHASTTLTSLQEGLLGHQEGVKHPRLHCG